MLDQDNNNNTYLELQVFRFVHQQFNLLPTIQNLQNSKYRCCLEVLNIEQQRGFLKKVEMFKQSLVLVLIYQFCDSIHVMKIFSSPSILCGSNSIAV